MATVPANEVPSERFVEQMGNHFLMNLIGPEYTYFHIPTQSQEKTLGYDASLQGFKTLVIQYKRLFPNTQPFSGRVPIDPTQLATLQAKFPPAKQPYAFLGFSLHQSYGTVSPLFSGGVGSSLSDNIIYLDIHSPGLNSRPYPKSINSNLIPPLLGNEAWRLPDLASKFLECSVGLFQSEAGIDQLRIDKSEQRSLGNLSLLHAKLPGGVNY